MAAFETHLHTAHVQQFMASVPTLSTNGFDALVQLGDPSQPNWGLGRFRLLPGWLAALCWPAEELKSPAKGDDGAP